MKDKNFWLNEHSSERDEVSQSLCRDKVKQTFGLSKDQKPNDDFQEVALQHDISLRNIVPSVRDEAPPFTYNNPTRRMSGTHLEHHDVPSDKKL